MLQPVLAGGWFFGLFGLVPGALLGLVVGITHHPSARIALYVAAIIITCLCEAFYGYPTTIPAGCFYLYAPFAVPWIALFFVLAVKVRLGLMPLQEASDTEASLSSMFPDDGQ